MKIISIEVIHTLPRFSFVKMSTDEGIIGYGEAVIEGRSRTVEMAVKELESELIGQDPRRIEHLWQMMYRGTFYRGGPILTSAISGLEQAMWDILGKSLGVPVHQLLGGRVRDRIRMYKHVMGDTTQDLHQSAANAAKEGFTMVKVAIEIARILEPPAYLIRQVERIEAIRDAIGDEVDLASRFSREDKPGTGH
jgi:galactonate dehydratase